MIKKKRIILLIIFLLIFLVGCSKSDNLEEKEDTVKIKDYSEAEKVEFSNKDLEKTKNAVLSYAANPRKFNLTGYTIEAYRRLVGIDYIRIWFWIMKIIFYLKKVKLICF